MQTRTYGDLFKLIQSLAGVGSFAASEQDDVANLINRRYFEAYQTSQMWPRYLVAGEERTIESGQVVPYAETGKNTIGEFIRIHRQQPFLNNSTLEFDFYVDSSGAHILNISTADSSSAYITYKKQFAPFTTSSSYTTSTEEVPSEFFHFIAHSAYADFLRMDGQTDKALIEEATGKKYLDLELERVDLITNNNNVNKRFSTYVSRQAR
jgi:thiol:disulfide interchange protein